MRTFPVRLLHARASWRVLLAVTVLSFVSSPRAASAQLGKLKKLGADAIKDAAKDKLGGDKKAPVNEAATNAATAKAPAKEPSMPKLDDDRIELVLASLAPQVRSAQIRADAAAAAPAYEEKRKAGQACVEKATKDVNPMAVAATSQRNAARITAMQNQMEAVQKRYGAASKAKDLRLQAYLLDSLNVISTRMALLNFDVTCPIEYAPAAIVEASVLDQQRRSSEDNGMFDPGEATRGALSRGDFGGIRERIALWALMQANPALKGTGKEGVFSADEQAALARHSTEIAKLAPLFKADAMIWKTWDDLRDW